MESANGLPDSSAAAAKRKRSDSASLPPTAPSAKRTTSAQLSINYLARQSPEDLPLINKDDTLPNLLSLLSAYSNVLERHESLASNLGARPLGPILIKRFERCFDAPPKVVASHHKGAASSPEETHHTITWLEVIEFARSHPSQFTLSTFSEGRRVCQFYYPQKQLRVQISEEDFLFINSGRCQELIPPLPIWEDEEKEVGTCDVLETKLKELTNAADMVAARTRQLSHRLKGRRAAILERRAEGGSGTPAKAPPSAAAAGFVSVNADNQGIEAGEQPIPSSATVRNDLLRHFESLPHNQQSTQKHRSRLSVINTSEIQGQNFGNDTPGGGGVASSTSSLSPVPSNFPTDSLSYYMNENLSKTTPAASDHRAQSSAGLQYPPSTAASKHNFSRPLPPALESSQPFRPLCQAHMDSLPRGTRVLPPCDRCRRLRMDCVKNLTSCAGCTKKHARCHWKDVSRDEVGALDHLMDAAYLVGLENLDETLGENGYSKAGSDDESEDDDSNPLEDLEALGAKEDDERENAVLERIREDEEGLRNARELARMGYEDGLRGRVEGQPVVVDGHGRRSPPEQCSAAQKGITNDTDIKPYTDQELEEDELIPERILGQIQEGQVGEPVDHNRAADAQILDTLPNATDQKHYRAAPPNDQPFAAVTDAIVGSGFPGFRAVNSAT